MSDHADCRRVLRETWEQVCADVGSGAPDEITVSTEPPLVANPYITSIRCPHGTEFWIEPTGDQIARWRKDKIP